MSSDDDNVHIYIRGGQRPTHVHVKCMTMPMSSQRSRTSTSTRHSSAAVSAKDALTSTQRQILTSRILLIAEVDHTHVLHKY